MCLEIVLTKWSGTMRREYSTILLHIPFLLHSLLTMSNLTFSWIRRSDSSDVLRGSRRIRAADRPPAAEKGAPTGLVVASRSNGLTVAVGSALDQWGRVFQQAGRKFGRTFKVLEDGVQVRGMREAGFVDLRVVEYKVGFPPSFFSFSPFPWRCKSKMNVRDSE